jgi:hypothetical protein
MESRPSEPGSPSTWRHMWCMPAWHSDSGWLPSGAKPERLRHTRQYAQGTWTPPGQI